MENIIFKFFMFSTSLIFKLFAGLPEMPEQAVIAIDNLFGLIFQGMTLFNLFVDLEFIIVLGDITIALMSGMMAFKLVMWVVRKLPIASE